MRPEVYGPATVVLGHVVGKPFQANYEIIVKRASDHVPAQVEVGSYCRDPAGRTRRDISKAGPEGTRVAISIIHDPVAMRVRVTDLVTKRVILDNSEPDMPDFKTRRNVAKLRAGHQPEEALIEGHLCFALRTERSEVWLSEELDEILLLKEKQPDRETTYRLFGITAGAPDPSLFPSSDKPKLSEVLDHPIENGKPKGAVVERFGAGKRAMFVTILSPECREGGRDVGVETDNPSWEDIDAALRALDGKSRTVVLLMASGPTHMGIACSLRGEYVVYATQDNNVYNYLIGDSSARGEVEMAVGGQVLLFEASWVVSLEPMLRAARVYAETGELDTSQRWVAVKLDTRMT